MKGHSHGVPGAKEHVHGANCSHSSDSGHEHSHGHNSASHQQHSSKSSSSSHVHSASCSHGAPAPAPAQHSGGHVHSASCSHGKQAAAKAEHVHSASCSHGTSAARVGAGAGGGGGGQPKMTEGSSHVHGANCKHGHVGEEANDHPQQDLSQILYGGEMPECKTPEERAVAVEALPAPIVGDMIGKLREMWRLARVLFEKKSYPMSLHLFAECIRLGGCRWVPVGEGPKYWGDTIYNVFHALPSTDKLDLAVYASWAHWWIVTTCLSTLQQQVQADRLPREVISQRIGEVKALQSKFESTMLAATDGELAAKRPQQTAVLWLALSVLYSNIRNSEKDLSCAQKAVQCDPSNFECQLRLGNSLIEAKRPDEAGPCYSAALSVLSESAPERMSAHLGAAYCALGDIETVMKHFRELRGIDLQYSAAAGLRFAAISREIIQIALPEVLKAVRTELAKGGVCNWCLKKDADKRCSACNATDYCSAECFKLAWKGDNLFPPHKALCVKAK